MAPAKGRRDGGKGSYGGRNGDGEGFASTESDEDNSLNGTNGTVKEEKSGCCSPLGCLVGESLEAVLDVLEVETSREGFSSHRPGESIDPEDPEDAVRVVCNNPECQEGQFMHKGCFEIWEESILQYLKSMGRARSWSEKQRHQNIWTKKGYDLAYKACDCLCGRGHLRKDLAYFPPPTKVDDDKKLRRRRKSGGKHFPLNGNGNGSGNGNGNGGGGLTPRMRSRTLSLGSAAALGLRKRSPPGTPHSLGASADKSCSKSAIFSDLQVQTSGSIFKRRESMSSFNQALPRWKVNGFHIKMEDDCPQGNDDTRIFVLTSLGDRKMREVPCLLCRSSLVVYDRYPLIDGTFFLSPINREDLGVEVKQDGGRAYMFAVCVRCLESSRRVACAKCSASGWFLGDTLVLGTLYTYDVLSATPCCPPECNSCHHPLPASAISHSRPFSSFTEPSPCPNCSHRDNHFLRKLSNIRLTAAVS